MNYFAKNIHYLRKKREITQAQIPDYLNINRATWSNYEIQRTEPSLEQLIEISTFFRISLDDLLTKDITLKDEVNKNIEPKK